jgi:hypothetical protein
MIELMFVMAVIVVLVSLVVPAVSNFGKATGLVAGGNMVVNLAGVARQTAMTRNSLSALVLLGAHGSEDDFRAFSVLSYEPGVAWTAVTPWQALPEGIVVDRSGEMDLSDGSSGTFVARSPKALPFQVGRELPVRHHGKPVYAYALRVFLPGGSLQNAEEPAHLRLVEGFLNGAEVTYTRPGAGGKPANFYDVALIGATGIAKASRP